MCEEEFFTPSIVVPIQGTSVDPWHMVDPLEEYAVDVSQGKYKNRVEIDWAPALDNGINQIDQFRVYRRLYQPSNPLESQWEQIFSSEDITWFFDLDLAAGTLYEYRVGAIVTCDADGGNNVTEYHNPTPYPIGFRSNVGKVEGQIHFEDGSPVDSVFVVVEPQGSNLSRNSLLLEANEFVTFDLNRYEQIEGGAIQMWPNIHTTSTGTVGTAPSHLAYIDSTGLRVEDGISISQWVSVPKSTILGEDGVGGAKQAPLFP